MFKSIQIKVLLITIIIAVLMLAGAELFFIYQMEQINSGAAEIRTARAVAVILLISFILISAVIIAFASRTIISPISKLIKNAKKIAEGENLEKFLRNGRQRYRP